MTLLIAILSDLGIYAAVVAVFAASVCYRANPLRAVNRYMAVFLFSIAAWQTPVVLARTTHQVRTWGPLAAPGHLLMLVMVVLLHNVCVTSHVRLGTRLGRNPIIWLLVFGYALTWIARQAQFYGWILDSVYYRLAAIIPIALVTIEITRPRNFFRTVNASERLIFQVTTVYYFLTTTVFCIDLSPASSRINTLLTFAYLAALVGLLISDRAFHAGGTTRIALAQVVRFAVHVILILPILGLAAMSPAPDALRIWIFVGLAAFLIYPIQRVSESIVARTFRSLAGSPERAARDRAMTVLGEAQTEAELLRPITLLAQEIVGGPAVEIIVATDEAAATGKRALLVQSIPDRYLSPETAVRSYRGKKLDSILDAFAETGTGAVLKFSGQHVVTLMYVAERSGGAHPFSSHELDLLHELTTIAGSGAERLRVVDDNLRAHGLAVVGQLAADLSRRARDQIAAIQTFVEIVKDRHEARLPAATRDAVYQQTIALAATHNLTLEITRLQRRGGAHSPVALRSVIQGVIETYRQMAENRANHFDVSLADPNLSVVGDERLLRQILLILVRNSVQAAAGQGTTLVMTIRVWAEDDIVHLELMDNGPGLPSEVHDRLHSPSVATTTDTTGLGLAFCVQALRSLGGQLSYLRPRGSENAWFRLDFPRAASAPTPAEAAS